MQPDNRRAVKPALPAAEGWWLARSSGHGNFYDLEYVRELGEPDFAMLITADRYFGDVWRRPEIRQLYDAYNQWRGMLSMASGSLAPRGHVPGPVAKKVTDGLITYLLVWRMALDQFKKATLEAFGRRSKQFQVHEETIRLIQASNPHYRAASIMRNRVQHQDRPPLTQLVEHHPYRCDQCGEDHATSSLSVTMPEDWLRTSESRPGSSPDKVGESVGDVIDIQKTVDESLQCFGDLVFAVVMSRDDAPGYLTALAGVFAEATPHRPLLVEWQKENGGRNCIHHLDGAGWAVARLTPSE